MNRQINIKCSYEPMASTCSGLVPHAVTTPLQCARARLLPMCTWTFITVQKKGKKKKGKRCPNFSAFVFGWQSNLLSKYFSNNTEKNTENSKKSAPWHPWKRPSPPAPLQPAALLRCSAAKDSWKGLRHVCFKFILHWKCRTPICFGSLKIEPRSEGEILSWQVSQ